MTVFPGFNTNIRHKNKVFHIQTEVLSSGTEDHSVSTLVYLEGRIYHSDKSFLKRSDALHRETAATAIVKQHKEAIKKLISNQLKATDPATSASKSVAVDFLTLYQDKNYFSCGEGKPPLLRRILSDMIMDS